MIRSDVLVVADWVEANIEPTLPHLGWMILTGLLMSSGHFFLVQALRRAPVATVSAFQYTQLVWGLAFGMLLFGDFPDVIAVLGAALVIGSAFYVGLMKSPATMTESHGGI